MIEGRQQAAGNGTGVHGGAVGALSDSASTWRPPGSERANRRASVVRPEPGRPLITRIRQPASAGRRASLRSAASSAARPANGSGPGGRPTTSPPGAGRASIVAVFLATCATPDPVAQLPVCEA